MKAGTVGGIEAVAKAINAHISSADACYAGCYALGNMTGDNGKNAKIQLRTQVNEQLRTK